MRSYSPVRWLGLILAILLASCGAAAPAASVAEQVTIRMWSHQNSAFNKVNQELIDQFMKENPNIIVKYETFPYDQFIQTLQTSMPAGTEADVIEMFGSWVCNYATGGRLQETPAEVMSYTKAQEIFYKAPLDGYYCDGKLYGMPNEYNLEYSGALVNPALYEAAGIAFPPEYKHFNFESEEALNVIRTLTRYAQDDKVIDATLFSGDNGLPGAFFKGQVGIAYIGPWAAGVGKVDFPDVKFEYVALPPMFGSEYKFAADAGWGKVVSTNTKHSKEAWMLQNYLTVNRANALKFNQISGTVPALKELVENPAEILAVAPYMQPILKLLPYGQYLGNVTDRDQLFYEIIAKNLTDAVNGSVTPEQAAANMNAEANAMVDSKASK